MQQLSMRPALHWLVHATLIVQLVGPVRGAAAAQECDVRGTVETPTEEALIADNAVVISGWAADINAPIGTGVTVVRVALDADPGQDGVPVIAAYGWERPDIADLLGAGRFLPSGFALTWDTTSVQAGRHSLYIQAQSACGWTTVVRTVLVAGPRFPSPVSPPTTVRTPVAP
jgi:hypothetical protein